MTIAIATLDPLEKTEFLTRKNQLTSDQRECLNKIMSDIASQELQKGGTADDVAREIAKFITDTVLTGYPDYCQLYRTRLQNPSRARP